MNGLKGLDGLTPLKKKFCDKLLEDTENQTRVAKEIWPHLTMNSAGVKATRLLKEDNVVNYLISHSKNLQGHLVKLAYNAKSEQVQAQCTINALDRIMGRAVAQADKEVSAPTVNVLNYYVNSGDK